MMESTMEPIMGLLDQLKLDHQRTRLLLGLLAREIAECEETRPADFDEMRDIAQYLTHYPELVHHPAEERLVERLKCRGTKTVGNLFGRIVDEHHELAKQGSEFLEIVSRVADGGLTLRSSLIESGLSYIKIYRAHLAWEEEHLFAPASQLTTADLAILENDLAHVSDPLFGPILQQEYADLFQYIQDHA